MYVLAEIPAATTKGALILEQEKQKTNNNIPFCTVNEHDYILSQKHSSKYVNTITPITSSNIIEDKEYTQEVTQFSQDIKVRHVNSIAPETQITK